MRLKLKKLLIRADDLGYSEAINYGIEKSVRDGLIRSVGLMPNMPAAAHGLRLMEGTSVCIGQHTNICLGKPCADPEKIPSLLDPYGNLRSSREYRDAYQKGEQFTVLEEMVLEVEAQYLRFMELTGRKPAYFEAHAVISDHLVKALEIVAEKYQLRFSNMFPGQKAGDFDGTEIHQCEMESMKPDYDPAETLRYAVETLDEERPNIFVCHPGYLDDYVLSSSTLTVNRTKEIVMLCDPAVRDYLIRQGVELITYDDL